jgi:uncharacterized damage-inducible protein DinB
MSNPEYWLRGPVIGVPALLQPVAHALLQAREDIAGAVSMLTPAEVWARPEGAAAVGFHLKHLAGSLDRLLTYARGDQLSNEQLAYLKAEADPGEPPAGAAPLLAVINTRIDAALEQVKSTPDGSLLEERRVGRKGLLSTTIGLLFHAAEHTTRHAAQIITTAKIVTRS